MARTNPRAVLTSGFTVGLNQEDAVERLLVGRRDGGPGIPHRRRGKQMAKQNGRARTHNKRGNPGQRRMRLRLGQRRLSHAAAGPIPLAGGGASPFARHHVITVGAWLGAGTIAGKMGGEGAGRERRGSQAPERQCKNSGRETSQHGLYASTAFSGRDGRGGRRYPNRHRSRLSGGLVLTNHSLTAYAGFSILLA